MDKTSSNLYDRKIALTGLSWKQRQLQKIGNGSLTKECEKGMKTQDTS